MNPSDSPSPRHRPVLALPAWRRVVGVLPVLALLWLGVWWASLEATPL